MSVLGDDPIKIYEKLHMLLKEGDEDHNHGDDPIYLQRRVREQRSLLEQLAGCIQKSEDARKVMETRQKHLLTENEELQDRLNQEKDKSSNLRLRYKAMQKNTEKFSKMKEEYKAMCKAVREEKLRKDTADKKTSCTNLIKVRNKCTQAWVDCPRCEDGKRDKKTNSPGVRLTKSELYRLEKDMQALKMVINQREAMWCKLAERERLQRVQLTRLNNELTNLRALSETRQSELENKTQALSDLNMHVERQRLESATLRRHIQKLERREREYADLYELNMELFLKKLHKEQEEGTVSLSASGLGGKRLKRHKDKSQEICSS